MNGVEGKLFNKWKSKQGQVEQVSMNAHHK